MKDGIVDITTKLTEHDLVVWDNFPDDMSSAVNVESGLEALATISSARVENLILALNPKLLEKYRNDIGGVDDYLASRQITYDKYCIKWIIEEYGNNSPPFRY